MKSRSGSPQSICSYRRAYDARFAVLTRERRFWDRADRETSLRSRGIPQYREDARRGAGADARGGQLAGTAHLREWRAIGRFEGPFRVYGNGMETNGQAEY